MNCRCRHIWCQAHTSYDEDGHKDVPLHPILEATFVHDMGNSYKRDEQVRVKGGCTVPQKHNMTVTHTPLNSRITINKGQLKRAKQSEVIHVRAAKQKW